MSAPWLFLILFGIWAILGASLGLLMSRLGHSGPMWAAIGALFGPFSIALAFQAVGDEPDRREQVTRRGRPGAGPINVLVGIDSSVESHSAMRFVVGLLGPQIGKLTLATVLDFESGEPGGSRSVRRTAEQILNEAGDELAKTSDLNPTLSVLNGRTSTALQRHALGEDFHLIAIGSRGTGMARTVLGSVATDLARATTTPVLIASRYETRQEPGPCD